MYLAGLNSFGGVIIITNTSRFKGVKDRKYASVISTLLNIIFDVADL